MKAKFITFLGLSGLTVLLSAFFLTIFGVVDLTYVNSLKLNFAIEYFGKLALFQTNIILICVCIFKKINVKFLSISFLVVILLGVIISENFFIIISTIYPIVLFSIYKLKTKEKILVKATVFVFALMIFQIVFGIVKVLNFKIAFNDTNLITSLILSIDLILFYIFYAKVVKAYVGFRLEHTVECSFLSELKSNFRHEKTSKETLNDSDLNARQKALFAVLVLGYQLFQMAVVLAIGFINNMFIELLVMLPIFWTGRTILQKSWHSDKLWICSVATFSGFYILTKVTPPFEISLFLVVALTGAFIYILHILGVKADRLEELEEKYETDFTKYGLSAEMAKFAYDWLTDGMHDKELMIKYKINSVNTLNSRKRRIKKAMHTI